MGRYVAGRVRKKGNITSEQMQLGIDLHIKYHHSIRKAAQECHIPFPTLRRYVIKFEKGELDRLEPNYSANLVFTHEQELSLKQYIEECDDKFFGLTIKECCQIAYQMAKMINIKIPKSWEDKQVAGKDWLRSFKVRFPDLKVRTPEASSLTRTSALNEYNVQHLASPVINLNESSTTTVPCSQKVLSLQGNVCRNISPDIIFKTEIVKEEPETDMDVYKTDEARDKEIDPKFECNHAQIGPINQDGEETMNELDLYDDHQIKEKIIIESEGLHQPIAPTSQIMERNVAGRVRKKGNITSELMQRGIDLHIKHHRTIRKSAKECEIPFPTLRRYVKKFKQGQLDRLEPNYSANMVFTYEQELSLKQYIEECADKFCGLTTKECCQIAYQMAKLDDIKIPKSWENNQEAGKEWLRGFKRRFPDLTVKKPEACSLARTTVLNEYNVQHLGSPILNLNESSTTTVQCSQKVLSQERSEFRNKPPEIIFKTEIVKEEPEIDTDVYKTDEAQEVEIDPKCDHDQIRLELVNQEWVKT